MRFCLSRRPSRAALRLARERREPKWRASVALAEMQRCDGHELKHFDLQVEHRRAHHDNGTDHWTPALQRDLHPATVASAGSPDSLETRRPTDVPGHETGVGWFISNDFAVRMMPETHGDELAWKAGGTGGFLTFIGFSTISRHGSIALSNAFRHDPVDLGNAFDQPGFSPDWNWTPLPILRGPVCAWSRMRSIRRCGACGAPARRPAVMVNLSRAKDAAGIKDGAHITAMPSLMPGIDVLWSARKRRSFLRALLS